MVNAYHAKRLNNTVFSDTLPPTNFCAIPHKYHNAKEWDDSHSSPVRKA